MVGNAVDELRRQFFLSRGPRHIKEIAEEMRVTRQTLARFTRGSYVSFQTLAKIEAWIATTETRGVHDC